MKFFIALFALVAVATCSNLRRHGRHHHISQNVTDMIVEYGYPVQNFTVQTSDGYVLDVIRIPGGVEYKNEFERKQRQEQDSAVTTGKPVVVLMHGLLSSAEDFVIGGPVDGLAFVLANRGYDVFMPNARGNIYSRKHVTLNPEKDAAFWRFCWNDIGKKDLPVVIDEILRITQQEKITYIGHMQGATVFYVMVSELPEYNTKIERMISMGPIAYMRGATNEMLKTIADNQQSKSWLMKNLGVNEFHPSTEFMTTAGEHDCISRNVNERICQNPFFLINGYESDYINKTTVQKYVPRLPAGSSTRQVLHYAQLIKSGRFEKYIDESQVGGVEYDMSRVTVPISMVYAPNDKISTVEDIKYLINKLPNVVNDIKIDQITNNLDLIFAKNVNSVVYKRVVDILLQN